MVCKVVASQKVGNRVVSNEVVHSRPTCSWGMVTGTGGHQRGQKEWRLETRWNAAGRQQRLQCNHFLMEITVSNDFHYQTVQN